MSKTAEAAPGAGPQLEGAVEQIENLLALRAAYEKRTNETAALTRATEIAMTADDMTNGALAGVANVRARRAFLSAALGKPSEEIDSTLLDLSWERLREMTPTAKAYAEGLRALVAQLALDRPSAVCPAIISMLGAETIMHMVAVTAEQTYNAAAETPAGSSSANIHTGTEARN
jgi:hypothetical protein